MMNLVMLFFLCFTDGGKVDEKDYWNNNYNVRINEYFYDFIKC